MQEKETKTEKVIFYLNMIFGSVGLILIAVGISQLFIFFEGSGSTAVYALPLIGLILTIQYIYYLEKKAEIKNTVIWVKMLVLILIIVSAFQFVFI